MVSLTIVSLARLQRILLHLYWLPVHQRITLEIRILAYQAYHETTTHYLCDLIVPYANICNFRFNNNTQITPYHPRAKLNEDLWRTIFSE